MAAPVSACVRMYRLNELGDCFLLTLTSGEQRSRMLIDCGSFRNGQDSADRLQKIVKHIQTELDGRPLDVAIATHQHNDHVSGFAHCEQLFRDMKINQVWLSWLDNANDPMAQAIGKKHNNFAMALYDARSKINKATLDVRGSRAVEIIDDMLGFYGAGKKTPPKFPAEAVALLKTLGSQSPKYLQPGNVLQMPGLPQGTVRVYVLGPPRNSELLYRKDPRTGESYDHKLALWTLAAQRLLGAAGLNGGAPSADEMQYPFGDQLKIGRGKKPSGALRAIRKAYRSDNWRTINEDWMQEAEGLALFLDSFTNNSSLVLAVELVDSGKVLLFAADAQTGNWLSWPDAKWEVSGCSTNDLLSRTVLYKVGHHGSHNATLLASMEKMTSPELVALIPVHKQDGNIKKKNGWKMPARKLLARLIAKTGGRTLQMDGDHAAGCDPFAAPAKKSWKDIDVEPVVKPLYMEITIR